MNKFSFGKALRITGLSLCLLLFFGSLAYYAWARAVAGKQTKPIDLPISEYERIELDIPTELMDLISLDDCRTLALKLEDDFPFHEFYISTTNFKGAPEVSGRPTDTLVILLKHSEFDFEAYQWGIQGERSTTISCNDKLYNIRDSRLYHDGDCIEQMNICRSAQSWLDAHKNKTRK